MNRKKIFLTAFILAAIVQLYVPAKMILDREEVLDSGKEYKFKIAPIDPTDPFRGKYIYLRYDENVVEVNSESNLVRGEAIYVLLATDNYGFAKIKSITKEAPTIGHDYVRAKVASVTRKNPKKVTISYPFDRYYMEESKAYDAEQAYRKSQIDTNMITYALVSIKGGESVLKDILIDGISIKEIVNKQKENQK